MFSIFLFCLGFQGSDAFVYHDTGMSSHETSTHLLERFTEYFVYNPSATQSVQVEVTCTDANGDPLEALEGQQTTLEFEIPSKGFHRFLPARLDGIHYTGFVRITSNKPLITANRRRFAFQGEVLTDLVQPLWGHQDFLGRYVLPSVSPEPFTNPILSAKNATGFTSSFTITENPVLAIRNTEDFTTTMILKGFDTASGLLNDAYTLRVGPRKEMSEPLDDLFPGSGNLRLDLTSRDGKAIPYYRLSSQRTSPALRYSEQTQTALPFYLTPEMNVRVTVTPANTSNYLVGQARIYVMPGNVVYSLPLRSKIVGAHVEFDLNSILPPFAGERIGVIEFNAPFSRHQVAYMETIDGETPLNAMTELGNAMTFLPWEGGQDMLHFLNPTNQPVEVLLMGQDGSQPLLSDLTVPPGVSAFEVPEGWIGQSPILQIRTQSQDRLFASYLRYDSDGALVEQYPLFDIPHDPRLQGLHDEIPAWQDAATPLCNGSMGATILDFVAYINNDYNCPGN